MESYEITTPPASGSSTPRYRVNDMEIKPKKKGIRGWQVAVLMLLSGVVSVVLVFAVLINYGNEFYSKYDSQVISDLLQCVDQYYYFDGDKPDTDKLLNAAAKALVAEIGDPYAEYFSDEEYNAYRDNLNGNYKGIGVLVSLDPDGRGLMVERAYINNPAYNAGVRDGDIITSVNGNQLKDRDLNEASELLMGDDGSTAELGIMREGEQQPLTISVKRGDVTVTRVFSERLENNIGYICIEEFTGDAAEAFDTQLNELLNSGITSLIIDLRNNPGGSLDTVVEIADRVLPECTITTLSGKMVDPPREYRSDNKQKLDIPYVVLVNGNSASASEVFSSAVQDNNAAKLIGTTTFGKGIVQTSWSLGEGEGMIKLTTDAYTTPNGRHIHGVGLTPDIAVELPEELEGMSPYALINAHRDSDTQLSSAIEYLLSIAD